MVSGKDLVKDVLGGVATSVIALPMGIAFGVVAFAPLGEDYVARGALAGLYGVIVAGILTSLFGGTRGQISVPTAPAAVMVTAVIASLLQDPEISALGPGHIPVVLLLVALTIALAGLLQWVLAAIGGGKLVKYIPYPVIAGFMNGIAIIILASQLPPFLGTPKDTGIGGILSGRVSPSYDILLVGVATIAGMLAARRWLKAVPDSLVGLACGIAAYFALGALHSPQFLSIAGNPFLIGPIPGGWPQPTQAVALAKLGPIITTSMLAKIALPAATLAVLAAIDTLLTSVVADTLTRTKHNSTRELLGQGLGNIGSAAFGGLPVSGSTLATLVNVNSGARTALSGVVTSLTVMLVVAFLGGLVQWIPLSALAGILLLTALSMLETESIHLSLKKSTVGNLAVIAAVTGVTVGVGLVPAVVVGLAITAFLFVREQISRPIVQRTYTVGQVFSKKVRSPRARWVLEHQGDRIRVYELNGSLFFGTCDQLLRELEEQLDSFCIILDFKRVHTIDLTGAQLLREFLWDLRAQGGRLVLSYLDAPSSREKARICAVLRDVGVVGQPDGAQVFVDTDHALEWAEDALVEHEDMADQYRQTQLSLENLDVFQGLSEAQLGTVSRYLHPQHFDVDEVVFEEGDPGDRIYFILSGAVSIFAAISGEGRARRLASYGEGVFFGDMAILEGEPRSATVRADTETEVLYMTFEDFQRLVEGAPVLTSRILLAIARELSHRLRLTSLEVQTLEE